MQIEGGFVYKTSFNSMHLPWYPLYTNKSVPTR